MKDEDKLIERYGKKQPFTMPEGYLEQLHEQLMSNLPETQPTATAEAKVTLMTRIKPLLYMAAMFVGIIFMVQGIMYVQQNHVKPDNLAAAEELYDPEVDDFMASSLYSEYALYSYLTSTDYD